MSVVRSIGTGQNRVPGHYEKARDAPTCTRTIFVAVVVVISPDGPHELPAQNDEISDTISEGRLCKTIRHVLKSEFYFLALLSHRYAHHRGKITTATAAPLKHCA